MLDLQKLVELLLVQQLLQVILNITDKTVDIEFELGKLTISIDEKNSIHMKGPVSNIRILKLNCNGYFDKFKTGFKKSASTFHSGLKNIIIKTEIDDKTLDQIEEYLIQSDVGLKQLKK